MLAVAGAQHPAADEVRIHQQAQQVTIVYKTDQQVRRIRMNQAHPANVIRSVYGDSVGSYDGDALVIDTVGVKVGPFAMVDPFGTPYSEALHVVERSRLIDYETGKEAIDAPSVHEHYGSDHHPVPAFDIQRSADEIHPLLSDQALDVQQLLVGRNSAS